MKWGRVLVASAVVVASAAVVPALADQTTIGYTNARPAWDSNEPKLAPSSVTAPDFGKLFDVTLPRPAGQDQTTFPNQIYAQPLVVGTRVLVATEENEVLSLDSETGAVQWRVSLGPAFTPTNCGDLVPHVGVTSTPVYDPATSTLYVSAKTQEGSSTFWKLHALDVSTGAERANWPVTIQGMPSNSTLAFNAVTANQRPGLMLMDGRVYIAYASHCDHGPYVGYVVGVNTSTRAIKLWSAESGLANDKAGIWMSGGAPSSDGSGRIFLATGNGVSPPPGAGTTPPGTLAESVVRLQVAADGTMSAKDFFSPSDNTTLDQNDTDFGSGAPILLPDSYGTASHPHLLLQIGKDGRVFLLDRDNLGGMGQGAGGTNNVVSMTQLSNGVWGRPAIFDTPTAHYVYLTPSSTFMRALRVAPNAQGVPTLSVVGTSDRTFPYTSSSPVVTSVGSDPSSALVWVARSGSGSSGTNSELVAYPAVPPTSGPWQQIFSAQLGTIAKFISVATSNGRVYVGTRDGRVLGFGRPVQSALTASPTEFGMQAVGTTSSAHTVTVTVQTSVTVNSVTTTGPFTAGTPSVALPNAFVAPTSFTVPVTFSPTAAGSGNGVLRFTTAQNDQYDFSLHGTGTQDGLAADPVQLDFGQVSTSSGKQLGVTITNVGTGPATIQTTTLPGAPYSVTGLPSPNTVLAAQQSVTATVTFQPTQAIAYPKQLTVTANTGTVTIPITGTGISGTPHMTLTPSSLDFGMVAPGSSRTKTFVVSNTGDAPMLITKAAPPAGFFTVATPINEGQSVQPGDTLTVSVTYAPKTGMPASDAYALTSSDGTGAQSVSVVANSLPWTGNIGFQNLCMEPNAALIKGTKMISGSCSSPFAQQFSLGTGGTIHLGAASSQWCVDAKGSGTATGTPIQVWTCNGSTAQVWKWRTDDTFNNPHANKCLLRGAVNAQLTLAPCVANSSQRWYLSYLFASRGAMSSGLGAAYQVCVTSKNGASTDNTRFVIGNCTVDRTKIIARVGNTMRLMNACITVAGYVAASKVVLKSCDGSPSQQWFYANGRLQNQGSGRCLYAPSSAVGSELIIRGCDSSAGEKWLVPGGI